MNRFSRRDLLLNENQISKIKGAKIALFGLGGVGGFALEALARFGIEDFILCDGDKFTLTNLNRQLLSLESNIGKEKVEVAKERILSINSEAKVLTYNFFINNETINNINLDGYYIVDIIDDVEAKILLVKYAKKNNLKMISMMGAGNRIDCEFIRSDISKTEYDPLSKIIRKRLREEGIDHLDCVYTKELPIKISSNEIGSFPNVCMKAGSKIASEVIKDIIC